MLGEVGKTFTASDNCQWNSVEILNLDEEVWDLNL